MHRSAPTNTREQTDGEVLPVAARSNAAPLWSTSETLPALSPSSPSCGSNSRPPQDHAAWVEQARSQLHSARSLREHALTHLRSQDFANWGSPRRKPKALNYEVLAAQDKLKRSLLLSEHLAAALASHMSNIDNPIAQVGRQIRTMNHLSATMKGALGVVEKRVELRKQRPAREAIADGFEEALVKEMEVIKSARHKLETKAKHGLDVLKPLEDCRDEMIRTQNTFHLDSSGYPQRFLKSLAQLEVKASAFCRECIQLIAPLEKEVAQANVQTVQQMKMRTRELCESRWMLQREIDHNRAAITAVEHSHEKVQKELRVYASGPENESPDEDVEDTNDALKQKELLPEAVIDSLRAKIKAASYTGQEGRQLAAVFSRFDRDGSGELEEPEFKRAMRRTLRISPATITDAEISLLFAMLDGNASGTISVKEIMGFLNADSRQKVLHDRFSMAQKYKDDLQANLQELLDEYHYKTTAWKIDDACAKVTTVHGLELDAAPSLRKAVAKGAASKNRRLGRQLDDEAKEKLRQKLNAAAYTGYRNRQLDLLLRRAEPSDREETGRLFYNEVTLALRRILKISAKVLADPEVYSLCQTLDPNNNGYIYIADLVAFIGPGLGATSEAQATAQGELDALRSKAKVALENLYLHQGEDDMLTQNTTEKPSATIPAR